MKKWILPLLAAVFVLQGCADKETQASAVAESAAPVTEEYSEGESRSTILEEKLEKEALRREEESAQAEAAGSTFTDDLGRTVTVERHDRVVTLIGSFTELWLLAGGDVVGAANDSWTSFDLQLGEDVVNVGSHLEPDIEKIIALKPDFVIASANTEADMDLEKILENAGITTAYFSVSNFNEYMNMLEICTDITGREDLYRQNGIEIGRAHV